MDSRTTCSYAHLFIRTDASSLIGIGHFMRCFALAQYWRDHNGEVTFLGSYPQSLVDHLTAEGIEYVDVPSPHPDPADLKICVERIPPAATVVLDGYDFDQEFQRSLSTGRHMMVIDDIGHQQAYAGEWLLNQNSSAEQIHYQQAPSRQLLGPRFAMLGRSYRNETRTAAQPQEARRILVTLGGADTKNRTLLILQALAELSLPEIEITVVAGPANPNRPALQAFCESQPKSFRLEPPGANMQELMAWSDLAIAAAGSTCWELCFMGVPSILLSLADNQQAIGSTLESAGAALFMGAGDRLSIDEVGKNVGQLLKDPILRQQMSICGQQLIDGGGVARVAAILNSEQPDTLKQRSHR